jgi:hypothetical protein
MTKIEFGILLEIMNVQVGVSLFGFFQTQCWVKGEKSWMNIIMHNL